MKVNIIDIFSHIEDITIAGNKVCRNLISDLKCHELTPVELMLLLNIPSSPVTSTEIALKRYYKGTNCSYNVGQLIKKGYLRKSPNRNDARSILIHFTEKGVKLRNEFKEYFDKKEFSFNAEKILASIYFIKNTIREIQKEIV